MRNGDKTSRPCEFRAISHGTCLYTRVQSSMHGRQVMTEDKPDVQMRVPFAFLEAVSARSSVHKRARMCARAHALAASRHSLARRLARAREFKYVCAWHAVSCMMHATYAGSGVGSASMISQRAPCAACAALCRMAHAEFCPTSCHTQVRITNLAGSR